MGQRELPDIAEWQARSHTLASIHTRTWKEDDPDHLDFLEGKEGSTGVAHATVSANLFSTLGVDAAMGRTFPEGRVAPRDRRTPIRFCGVMRYGGMRLGQTRRS